MAWKKRDNLAPERVFTGVRFTQDLLDRIDQRSAAVGLSRNEWIVRALTWALNQPVQTQQRDEQL